MIMFSYFKNKFTKAEEFSPTKKTSSISENEEIFIQQLQNYIQLEQGYQVLKTKLFNRINSSYCFDSPFIQELVIFLCKSLATRDLQHLNRTLDIIEDLISNCGTVCNEAFNDSSFCSALEATSTAVYYTSIKVKEWGVVRRRAAGIILYLAKKYENDDHHYRFGKSLRTLYEMNANVPETSSIVEVAEEKAKQPKISKAEDQINVQQVLHDISIFIAQTGKRMAENPDSIDTNYVRSMKAKSKILYDMASKEDSSYSKEDKETMSKEYKKLRTFLKQIDKRNVEITAKRAIDGQKQFLAKKAELIGGKLEMKKLSSEGKPKQPFKAEQQNDLLDQEPRSVSPKRDEAMSPKRVQSISPKKQHFEIQYSTPVKNKNEQKGQNEEIDLLNMESPNQIKLEDIYKSVELSKDLSGIDLSSGSKESDAEFGEFHSP